MRSGVVLALCLASMLRPIAAFGEVAPEASDDEFELLQQLRSLFREARYDEAVEIGGRILSGTPSTLVRAEAHQYVGASAELLGRTEEAEEHFEELLTVEPTFRMEQSEFPSEVLTLFENVRLRMQDRLRHIEEERRRAQETERLERERRLREEQQRLAELSRPRYMARELRRRHLALAFLPFGAGQFQNDHMRRGYAFLGVELGLTAASMVLWLLQAVTLPDDPDDTDAAVALRDGYQWASYAVYGALGVAVIWGMIDALVNFRPESERWVEVDEEDVPAEHRVRPGQTATTSR
jgi:hypothetical protein